MLGLEIPVVWLMCFMVRVMPSVMTQQLKRREEGSRKCLGFSGSCRGVGWFQGHRDNLLRTVSYLSFRPRDRKGEIFGGLVDHADAILTESTELLGGRTALHMQTPSILREIFHQSFLSTKNEGNTFSLATSRLPLPSRDTFACFAIRGNIIPILTPRVYLSADMVRNFFRTAEEVCTRQ
jgi:hypothetical protein